MDILIVANLLIYCIDTSDICKYAPNAREHFRFDSSELKTTVLNEWDVNN